MTQSKKYDEMTLAEQESFICHSAADIAQKMYYENDKLGLEALLKSLNTISERVRNCIDCLEMLQKDGNVYTKLWLILDYIGHGGINEDFVNGLIELSDHAQDYLIKSNGGSDLTEAEEREIIARLNAVLERDSNALESGEVIHL